MIVIAPTFLSLATVAHPPLTILGTSKKGRISPASKKDTVKLPIRWKDKNVLKNKLNVVNLKKNARDRLHETHKIRIMNLTHRQGTFLRKNMTPSISKRNQGHKESPQYRRNHKPKVFTSRKKYERPRRQS